MKRMWSKLKVRSRMMRLLFSFTVLFCLLGRNDGYANDAGEPRLTVEFKKAVLLDVLKYIKQHTMYDFLCNNDEIKTVPLITKAFTNATVEEILSDCLKDTDFRFRVAHNVIVISKKKGDEDTRKEVIVKGKVMDEKGEPLPGATILVKNTRLGVATNVDGIFSISLPAMDAVTLVIQFVGMKSKEVVVTDFDKELSIRLEEDKKEMEEVVVTGYGNIRKSSFTGNSISVTQDELLKVSKTNIIQALQTFDPSFRIRENNQWGSDPNAVPEMVIRGRSAIGVKDLDPGSLSKSNLKDNPNLPIFILDGFETTVEKVYDLDPNRIETTTILKDAAATALYGSRAANGVVVITTITPKAGEIQISYSMVGSVSIPDLRDYNLMNAAEKLATEDAAKLFTVLVDTGAPWIIQEAERKQEYDKKMINIAKGVDTYWLSKPLKTAFNHKHSLYLNGGTDMLRFGVDVQFNNQDGVMKGSERNRYGVGFSLDYRLKDLQIRNYVSYSVMNSEESPYGAFSDYATKLPYDEYKDDKGRMLKTLTKWNYYQTSRDLINPLYEATIGNFTKEGYNEILDNIGINWYITNALQLKGEFSINQKRTKYKNFIHPDSQKNTLTQKNSNNEMIENLTGELYKRNSESTTWNTNILLAYNESINKHNINFTAGFNAIGKSTEQTSIRYRGFTSGQFNSPSFAKEVVEKPSEVVEKSRLVGFLSSLNYTYDNIYLFDASFRVDGSSEFGKDNRYAPFWSTGVGLNIHNYDFLKGSATISLLKIRGSYGYTGKTNFAPYSAIPSHNFYVDKWYATGVGSSLMYYMGNDGLKWEKTRKIDTGLEIEIFNRLLYFRGTYYFEKTTDLITDVTTPSSSGYISYKSNLGAIENRGVELDLRSDLIRKKDMSLTLYINYAHNKNKIVEISEALRAYNQKVEEYYANSNNDIGRPLTKYQEGISTTAKFGMKSLGIDPGTGKELFLYNDGNVGYEWSPTQMSPIGDEAPKGQGAFGINFAYKGFTVFTSFLYEYGGDRYNQTLVDKVENANVYAQNVDKRVAMMRWQNPGDVTFLKDIKDRNVTTQPTSRFMQRYNVLTLSALTVGYDFPAQLINKIGLSLVRLEASMNDVCRWSSVKTERGLSYPFAQTVNFSLKVNF